MRAHRAGICALSIGLIGNVGCARSERQPADLGDASTPLNEAPKLLAMKSVVQFPELVARSSIAAPGQHLPRANGAGFLELSLASRSTEVTRLARSNDLWLEVVADADRDVPAVLSDGTLHFTNAAPSTDVVHAARVDQSGSWFEELRVLRDASAPTSFNWRVRTGPALAQLRLAAGAIEALDHQGRAHLRSPAPYAIDAAGTRRETRWAIEGAGNAWRVSTSLDTRGLVYPITLDPAWFSTGSMSTARYYAATVTLKDGRVMVIGGSRGSPTASPSYDGASVAQASAEIFDPKTSTWTSTKSMATARMAHGAALLPSGKVVVAGGLGPAGFATPLTSSEVYDPTADAWSATGPLAAGAWDFQLMTTGKGTVLRAGGLLSYGGCYYSTSGFAGSSTAEIYDETKGTWAASANSMLTLRGIYGAALLPSGSVLITGGFSAGWGCGGANSGAEIFDPATNMFAPTTSMAAARFQHVAVALRDGRILVGGGLTGRSGDFTSFTNAAEVYDPASGMWTSVAAMPSEHIGASSATIRGSTGLTYVFGGIRSDSSVTNAVLSFDPSANNWSSAGTLHAARAYSFAFASGTNVYVGGGVPALATGGALPSVEIMGSPIAPGSSCAGPGECASGYCVDGVCCDSACGGTCQACNEPGSAGKCTTVKGAPRGSRSCPASGSALCPYTCDGATASACTPPSIFTVCQAASCDTAGNFIPATYCDGAATALCNHTTGSPASCAPFACGTAGCVTTCAADSDCAATGYCDKSTSKCVARLGNGTAATAANQCASGFLADGVCCDSACATACHSCSHSGSVGTCIALDGVADPHGVCSTGACADVCKAGACGFKSASTVCSAAACSGSSFTIASKCDGVSATCPGATPAPCPGGYACADATSCKKSCANNADCAAGLCDPTTFTCVVSLPPDAGPDVAPDVTITDAAVTDAATTTGATDATAEAVTPVPTPPPVKGTFQRCEHDGDCKDSGHCVEGVCCDSPCRDRCHSCVLPGSPGKCTLEPLGTDLRNECGPSLSCLGTCDGTGGCIGAGPGSQCARNRCVTGSTGVGPAFCAAAGSACDTNAVAAFDCSPYACEPAFGTCRTSCVTSADCAPDNTCDPSTQTCAATPPAAKSGGCAMGRSPSFGEGTASAWLLLGLLGLTSRRFSRAGPGSSHRS